MRPCDEPEATAYSEETIFISMCVLGWLAMMFGGAIVVIVALVFG